MIALAVSPHDEVMSSAALREAPPRATDAAPSSGTDPHARLRRMFDEQYDFIWRSLRRFGLTADRADDAAQQVFVVASKKLDAIQVGSERSCLFGTAMRVAADLRRSASYRREVSHPDPGAELPGGTRPDELFEQHRAREALDGVLDDMDIELRSVFVLFELEEMSTADIAMLLAIPSGTVASRLRRARDDFRAKVARLHRAVPERGGLT